MSRLKRRADVDLTGITGRRAARCSAESQLEAGRGEREGIKKPDCDHRNAETGLVGVEFGSRHWISGCAAFCEACELPAGAAMDAQRLISGEEI